jgi:hypothetical protein
MKGVEPSSSDRQSDIIFRYTTPGLAGPEGFELSSTVLETVMLPLHHGPMVPRKGFEPSLLGLEANVLSLHYRGTYY